MKLVSALTSAICFARTNAWGPDGHTIVAHVAQKLLKPEFGAKLVAELENVSLNNASGWCDGYDHSDDGRWSANLHFIDMPDGVCKFDWKRDCSNDECNAGAIVNYTKQLADRSLSADRRLFALKFVIHMMGDLHQPMHVAHASDRGGNSIKINACHFAPTTDLMSNHRHGTNLHAVWDTAILVQAISDLKPKDSMLGFTPTYHHWEVISDIIEKHIDSDWSDKQAGWVAGLADVSNEAALRAALASFADETAALACSMGYEKPDGTLVKSGDSLERDYYLRAQQPVVEQLAKGGARLSALLASVFAESLAIVV